MSGEEKGAVVGRRGEAWGSAVEGGVKGPRRRLGRAGDGERGPACGALLLAAMRGARQALGREGEAARAGRRPELVVGTREATGSREEAAVAGGRRQLPPVRVSWVRALRECGLG